MATLNLNIDAKQAEAILKALKIGFESLSTSADKATQHSRVFAQDLKRGLADIKTAKLQGSLQGVSSNLAKLRTTAKGVSMGMADLVTSGLNVSRMYGTIQGQQYKSLVITESEQIVLKKLDAQYTKHASILAENTMLQKGYTTTMQKAMAVDQVSLAVSQEKQAVVAREIKQMQLQYLMTLKLTSAERKRAATRLGIIGPPAVGGTSASSAIAKTTEQTKKYTTATKGARTASKNLNGAMRGLAVGVGQTSLAYGSLLPLLAAYATTMASIGVVKEGAAFEYTTQYLVSIANNTQKAQIGLTGVRDALLDIKGVAHTPAELAEGVKLLVKAGFDASKAIAEIADMSKFATIAEMEMGVATELVRSQLSAWGKDVGTLEQTANMMAVAASSSAMSLTELGGALKQTTELAVISGISYNELLSGLGKLADMGIKGSMAGSAIRTAIIRLQAPTSAVNKQLERMGKNMDVFKPTGEFKGFIQMFKEVERVTGNMTDESKIRFFKELFGLRQMKGGTGIARQFVDSLKDGSLSLEELADNIKQAGEELTFVDKIFSDVAETVKIKAEIMKAAFGKSLTKAFESEGLSNLLDDLISTFESEGFVSGLRDITNALIGIVGVVADLVSKVGELSKIGVNFKDLGLLGYVIFGSNPPAVFAAGLILVNDQLQKVNDTLDKRPKGDNFWKEVFLGMRMPTSSKVTQDFKDFWSSWTVVGQDMINLFNPMTVSENWATYTGNNPLSAPELDLDNYVEGLDSFYTVTEEELKDVEELYEVYRTKASIGLKDVVKGFEGISDGMKEFNTTAKELWSNYAKAGDDSVQESLNQIKAIQYAWGSIKQTTIKDSSFTVDGKKVSSQYTVMRSAASDYYKSVSNYAYTSSQNQKAALDAYVTHFQNLYGDLDEYVVKFKNELGTVSQALTAGIKGDELTQLGELLKKAAEVGEKAFKDASVKIGEAIDNISKKERGLLNEIKGYAKDMASAHQTAGKARFDQLQKYSSEASQYYNKIKRINALNKRASELGKVASKLTGAERSEVYSQIKSMLSEALSLSQSLESTEDNGVTKAKAKSDALKGINEFQKRSIKLAEQQKSKAEEELQSLEEAKTKLQDLKTLYDGLITIFGKSMVIDLNTKEAQAKISELSENMGSLFDNSGMDDLLNKLFPVMESVSQNISKVMDSEGLLLFTNKNMEESKTNVDNVTAHAKTSFDDTMKLINGVWTNEWEEVGDKLVKTTEIAAKKMEKLLDDAVEKERTAVINIVTKTSGASGASANDLPVIQSQEIITSGASASSGDAINVTFTLPGSDVPIPAVMTQNDATELISQLEKANRLSS